MQNSRNDLPPQELLERRQAIVRKLEDAADKTLAVADAANGFASDAAEYAARAGRYSDILFLDNILEAISQNGKSGSLIRSSAEFVDGFVPPDYLLGGILQRRFCYSFTATTNTGKTAIMLLLAAHVALGQAIGDRNVERGRVLFLSGENPDDVRMRWIAMAQQYHFDVDTIEVHFVPGRFKISEMKETIGAEVERRPAASPSSSSTPAPPTSRAMTRTTTTRPAATPACCVVSPNCPAGRVSWSPAIRPRTPARTTYCRVAAARISLRSTAT